MFSTVTQAFEAGTAYILFDDYSGIDAHIERITRLRLQGGFLLSDVQNAYDLYRICLVPILVKEPERLAHIGQLTTSLAHEIRNPLSSVKMNSQIILKNMEFSSNDQRRMEIIVQEISRLEKILDEMLDFAKPVKLFFESVSIHSIMDACLEIMEARIKEKELVVIKWYNRKLPRIMIDHEKIEQVMLNVLLNSVEVLPKGLRQCQVFDPQVTILDIRLLDMNGLDVLQELIRQGRTNIVIITAFHDMDITIKVMKLGAFDYIPKPIDVEELERVIDKALKSVSPDRMAGAVCIDPALAYMEGKIIGKSRGMKEIFKNIGVLSENRVTVLIEGETGTGKELIARAIHCNSPFKDHPFQTINCSTIVGTLLESELFGHEKGSFTGASVSKKGKFELTGHGSIFLDEIGEIPYELQSKLLRFLQEKEFERLGGEKKIKSDARVIAANNRNLWEMVQQGTFREDLYYRLNVASIKVPPLKDRKQDIPLLVDHIIRKINFELSKGIRKVEGTALTRMMDYEWPGNVRELENVLTHGAINSHGEIILEELIAPLLGKKPVNSAKPKGPADKRQNLKDLEKDYIVDILNRTHWHLGKACELLGISRPTLRHKLKAYDLTEGHCKS